MNLHEARSYYMPKWRDVNTFLRKWLVWNASEARMESRKMCCETHQDYPVHLRLLIEVNRSPVRSRRKHHGRYRRYWIAMTWLYSVVAFAFAWCISLFVLSFCSPFAGSFWPGATQSVWTIARLEVKREVKLCKFQRYHIISVHGSLLITYSFRICLMNIFIPCYAMCCAMLCP